MLGERIAELRRQIGYSQRDLAKYLQVSPSAVGMYEQNRREPAVSRLVMLASLFDVSLDYLLTGLPDDPAARASLRDWYEDMSKVFEKAALERTDGSRAPFAKQELATLLASLLCEKA